jgi:hypothetical protein
MRVDTFLMPVVITTIPRLPPLRSGEKGDDMVHAGG